MNDADSKKLEGMAGYTPGPWAIIGEKDLLEDGMDDLMVVALQVGPDVEEDDIYIVNVGQSPVACINESGHSAINLANAKLIAAAPWLISKVKEQDREIAGLRRELREQKVRLTNYRLSG